MALRTLSSLTMVQCEATNFNGLPPRRSSNTLPHLSFTKPSWVVRTESNVRKKRRKKPDPPCVICEGSGRVDCHQCHGKGRTNNVDSEMLPKGKGVSLNIFSQQPFKMQMNEESNKPCLADSSLQWSQWQLLDSLLPTGGFAHSFGLEAAVQSRLVSGPDELKTFIIHVLENTGSLLLPYVYSAALSPTLETWHRLDRMLDATLTNEVSRKASISQGSALMRVASAMFSETPSLKTMRDTSLGLGSVCFHHAPIFGLICGALGFDITISQRAYLFITMRDVISAATRLNLVGPLGAAMLQHQIAPIAENILQKWSNRVAEEACQTAPLLDVVQGCHVYLFSRLFSS